MRVTISDDLADTIAAQLPSSGAVTLDQEIERRLSLVQHTPFSEKPLVLDRRTLDALAQRLGTGRTFDRPADLIVAINRLAGIQFQDVRIYFSAGQLGELAIRAERAGQSVEEHIGRIVKALSTQLFTTPPASEEWPQFVEPG